MDTSGSHTLDRGAMAERVSMRLFAESGVPPTAGERDAVVADGHRTSSRGGVTGPAAAVRGRLLAYPNVALATIHPLAKSTKEGLWHHPTFASGSSRWGRSRS